MYTLASNESYRLVVSGSPVVRLSVVVVKSMVRAKTFVDVALMVAASDGYEKIVVKTKVLNETAIRF